MKQTKKNNDFCSQLWGSWVRLESVHIGDKKDQAGEKTRKK